MSTPEPTPRDERAQQAEQGESRGQRLPASISVLGMTFLLTLVIGVVAYVSGMPLGPQELTAVCVIIYLMLLTLRWLWRSREKRPASR